MCNRQTSFRRFAKPLEGFPQILRHTLAADVTECQVKAACNVALRCCDNEGTDTKFLLPQQMQKVTLDLVVTDVIRSVPRSA